MWVRIRAIKTYAAHRTTTTDDPTTNSGVTCGMGRGGEHFWQQGEDEKGRGSLRIANSFSFACPLRCGLGWLAWLMAWWDLVYCLLLQTGKLAGLRTFLAQTTLLLLLLLLVSLTSYLCYFFWPPRKTYTYVRNERRVPTYTAAECSIVSFLEEGLSHKLCLPFPSSTLCFRKTSCCGQISKILSPERKKEKDTVTRRGVLSKHSSFISSFYFAAEPFRAFFIRPPKKVGYASRKGHNEQLLRGKVGRVLDSAIAMRRVPSSTSNQT